MEDAFGHTRFLIFYIFCGLVASFAQISADFQSQIPNVGASGAIAGVLGGYLLLYPKARVDILFFFVVIIRIVPVPAWIMLIIWFGLQIFGGINASDSDGGVAYWAHAGGFAVGLLASLPFWLRKGAVRFWRATDYHPPHPDAEYKYVRSSVPRVPKG